ncbi:MAG: non-heme iron oxygenase ferredoxin subunit [Acidimicrobiales bacterium]
MCSRGDLEPGTAQRFEVDGKAVAVVRIGDEFFCIADRCSHEDYSLSEGEVLTDECEIECWKHGSTFDLRTGDPCSLPATKPVSVFPVKVEGDDVMVDL